MHCVKIRSTLRKNTQYIAQNVKQHINVLNIKAINSRCGMTWGTLSCRIGCIYRCKRRVFKSK